MEIGAILSKKDVENKYLDLRLQHLSLFKSVFPQ